MATVECIQAARKSDLKNRTVSLSSDRWLKDELILDLNDNEYKQNDTNWLTTT